MNKTDAKQLDFDLNQSGTTIEQLIEVAGLSVALCIFDYLGISNPNAIILVIQGPGNNGKDAKTACKYLEIFKFRTVVVKSVDQIDRNITFDYILDGLFGFSYEKRSLNEKYSDLLEFLNFTKIPIISIDVPSFQDADLGTSYLRNP